MTNENDHIIETIDEDGNPVSFEVMDIITVDDVEYALLLPCGNDVTDEENELLIMRLKKDGEEFSFEVIEDDDEFDKVVEYIDQLEDEIDE